MKIDSYMQTTIYVILVYSLLIGKHVICHYYLKINVKTFEMHEFPKRSESIHVLNSQMSLNVGSHSLRVKEW